jgi:hypothetical protein
MAAVVSQYSNLATFSGDSVDVAIHGNGGEFSELESDVAGLDPESGPGPAAGARRIQGDAGPAPGVGAGPGASARAKAGE